MKVAPREQAEKEAFGGNLQGKAVGQKPVESVGVHRCQQEAGGGCSQRALAGRVSEDSAANA